MEGRPGSQPSTQHKACMHEACTAGKIAHFFAKPCSRCRRFASIANM